jgi:hypothetical protein
MWQAYFIYCLISIYLIFMFGFFLLVFQIIRYSIFGDMIEKDKLIRKARSNWEN